MHANLITEEAKAPKTDVNDAANVPRMPLKVHDLSKFGTFVNKHPGSKPLNSVPLCEAPLNDGDLITFGTNKTSFRLLVLFFSLLLLCTLKANPLQSQFNIWFVLEEEFLNKKKKP